MVDFMSVLYSVLGGDIFNIYADSKGLMIFDKFQDFCKDHSIFPSICSKATLTKIFNSQAIAVPKSHLTRCASASTTRNLTSISISTIHHES